MESSDTVGRRDTCPQCSWDLHACYNCLHYDAQAYNECREPQAERVLEKDKSNFCDYFAPRTTPLPPGATSKTDEVKAKFDALFKKK
ncbi:MAG: hypothetical protein ACREP8_09755 [Candidatus Binatia bacterium]